MIENNKKKKNKITIVAFKIDIIPLKKLTIEQSSLKTQADSLNIKRNGGDKTVSFANRTNSALQHSTQRES